MGDNEKYREWFLWLMEHRVRIFVVLAVASMVFVYARGQRNTEERLHAIENTVRYEPPPAYIPPNLDAFAATDVVVASLPVHRAVYVPVYSHIYYDGGRPYLLETTLSVRNVDPKRRLRRELHRRMARCEQDYPRAVDRSRDGGSLWNQRDLVRSQERALATMDVRLGSSVHFSAPPPHQASPMPRSSSGSWTPG